jgi:hypothetical protein
MMMIANTTHIVDRAKQRGLRWGVLQFILDYGDVHSGAEALFYYVRERSLPSYLRGSHLAEMAKHWVVIVSADNDAVITAYAVKDATRHIRHKCRRHSPLAAEPAVIDIQSAA